MADIQITDDLGKSAPDVKIDLSHPSSLLKYAKNEVLRLAVAPDFMERATKPLSTAAPDPRYRPASATLRYSQPYPAGAFLRQHRQHQAQD